MKFFSKKYIQLILIGIAIVSVGFYRDFVFKSINALLRAWDENVDYAMPSSLKFLENYDYNTIVAIKWGLTLLFGAVYIGISMITVQMLFKKRIYLKIVLVTNIVLIVISYGIYFIGSFFPDLEYKSYLFSRYFMGMVQSPFILMILIPAFKLSERENANISN